MNDKYKYLGKNTLIFAISSFGTKFLSFLLVPLYTNVLSKEEYGSADLITTTATLLIFVLTINIADAVLRFSIERKTNKAEILSYGIRILLKGSLICTLGLSLVFALNLFKWPAHYYVFILLNFIITALYQILTNYLRGIERIKQVAVAGIISAIVILTANILFLLVFKMGIIGYLVSLILGPLIASIYMILIIKAPINVYFQNLCDKTTSKAMRMYCVPLIFNNVALWINAFLDRYFVTGYCGVGENGIYSIASKIPTILVTCYTVFSQAWNLSAIKEFDPEDKDGFFSNTYRAYNSLITIVCSLLIMLNIPLARLLYAKEFFSAWQYSSLLLLSVMFNSLTIIIGSVFSAVKETKVIATTTIFSAIVNTALNAILIPLIGTIGAAISTVVAYIVMWIFRLLLVRRFILFRVDWVKNCVSYGLMAFQIVLEHMNGHVYVGQIICFLIIIVMYYREVKLVISKIIRSKIIGR